MGHQIKLHTTGSVTSVEVDGVRVEIQQTAPELTKGNVLPASFSPFAPVEWVKIAANGERLPDTADKFAAVLLPGVHPDFDLLYTAETWKCDNWSHGIAMGKDCTLFGGQDWQLWSDKEAELIIDRSVCDPAVIAPFRGCTRTDRVYWTRTPHPSPSFSDCAFYVGLGLGSVSYLDRNGYGRVRACRRVSASQFLAIGALS